MNDTARSSTPLDFAKEEEGESEVSGSGVNPKIAMWMRAAMEASRIDPPSDLDDDAVRWCGAFVLACCVRAGAPHVAQIPVRARSWRKVGTPVSLENAKPGWDIAVIDLAGIKDMSEDKGAGHVGFYLGHDANQVQVFGGNQRNTVGTGVYSRSQLLCVRRLEPPEGTSRRQADFVP